MNEALIREEKDLVVLLGSFLVYKQLDSLYDLVRYIESYSADDLFEIINTIKSHVPATLIYWLASFLSIVKDESLLIHFLKLDVDYDLVNQVVELEPVLVNEFIEFWGV
jgi:hypothetical protein